MFSWLVVPDTRQRENKNNRKRACPHVLHRSSNEPSIPQGTRRRWCDSQFYFIVNPHLTLHPKDRTKVAITVDVIIISAVFKLCCRVSLPSFASGARHHSKSSSPLRHPLPCKSGLFRTHVIYRQKILHPLALHLHIA